MSSTGRACRPWRARGVEVVHETVHHGQQHENSAVVAAGLIVGKCLPQQPDTWAHRVETMEATERERDAISRLVVVDETRLCGRRVFGTDDVLDRREVEVTGEHPVPFPEKPIEPVYDLGDAAVLALQVLELLPLVFRQQKAEQPERCHLLFHLFDRWKIARRTVWAHRGRVGHGLTVAATTDTMR